jgi:hypothetical protein
LGIHKSEVPRVNLAESLPSAVQTAIAPSLERLLHADRGNPRARNDRTAQARASHFVNWCKRIGFSDITFEHSSQAATEQILAAYAQSVAEGMSIKSTVRPHIKTIQGYLRGAAAPALAARRDDPRFLPLSTAFNGKRMYVPLLEKVFAIAKKWTPQSRPVRQPITVAILHSLVLSVPSHRGAELGLAAAVRDAAILGTFTGSRVSEYAQSNVSARVSFDMIPVNAASGDQGGKPRAFMLSDFKFYDSKHLQVSNEGTTKAAYVRILFRYTKGVRSFEERLFAAISASPFCPVAAAARVVRRWSTLQKVAHTPLFCFLRSPWDKAPTYLTDEHMKFALRRAAVTAYPQKNHLIHQHLAGISSHSLRVFACLCLKRIAWDDEKIAHQLRWNSDAVKYYTRQSIFQAEETGANLFQTVLRSS